MECPNCGAEVPSRARACPECGSCERTGWSPRADVDGPGMPDDEFDYDEFVAREFGARRAVPRGGKFFWWLIAVVVLIAFALTLVRW